MPPHFASIMIRLLGFNQHLLLDVIQSDENIIGVGLDKKSVMAIILKKRRQCD